MSPRLAFTLVIVGCGLRPPRPPPPQHAGHARDLCRRYEGRKLTIAALEPEGTLGSITMVPAKQRRPQPRRSSDGSVYLPSSQGGELIVVTPAR